jgi:hypothetical protein
MSRWQACVEVMQERPRRRQLQTLPHRVNCLIAYCQANGLSNISSFNMTCGPTKVIVTL